MTQFEAFILALVIILGVVFLLFVKGADDQKRD